MSQTASLAVFCPLACRGQAHIKGVHCAMHPDHVVYQDTCCGQKDAHGATYIGL